MSETNTTFMNNVLVPVSIVFCTFVLGSALRVYCVANISLWSMLLYGQISSCNNMSHLWELLTTTELSTVG